MGPKLGVHFLIFRDVNLNGGHIKLLRSGFQEKSIYDPAPLANPHSNLQGDLEKVNGLLSREVHDKEDTIEALRKQCADVKKLNLNMLSKVQVKERY